jgi:hypothetical protein
MHGAEHMAQGTPAASRAFVAPALPGGTPTGLHGRPELALTQQERFHNTRASMDKLS